MISRRIPAYDLASVKNAVASGSFTLTRRVRNGLYDHGWEDPDRVAIDVFAVMNESDFYKSDELEKRPGVFADIYKGVVYDETAWYVKFFIDEDGVAAVNI